MSYVGANRIIRKLRCAILGKSAFRASTPLQSGPWLVRDSTTFMKILRNHAKFSACTDFASTSSPQTTGRWYIFSGRCMKSTWNKAKIWKFVGLEFQVSFSLKRIAISQVEKCLAPGIRIEGKIASKDIQNLSRFCLDFPFTLGSTRNIDALDE